jgi:glyoxalase family protein
MKLEGIHHITCITGNAPQNVNFYAGTMGLRLVKKTVNQDDPTVYHLFYADEEGSAGADLTFFEYPGSRRGKAGAGMVHRIVWRVASLEALDFWEKRLSDAGVMVSRAGESVLFQDPEGLALELQVSSAPDDPLIADHPEIPRELALQGFAGARAFSADPPESRHLLMDGLGFTESEGGYESRGARRGSFYVFDRAAEYGIMGAGAVHHIAWACPPEDHTAWRSRVLNAGGSPTPVIDRFYFRSIYFREPSGVLFEIATIGPGFSLDEPKERLGERLSLPPSFEPMREKIEPLLTPLPNPRASLQPGAPGT